MISRYSYEYDNNGNIISVTENGQKTTYQYDVLNRLERIIRPDYEQITYSYDTRGNRKITNGDSPEIDQLTPVDFGYNSWDELATFSNGTDNYAYQYDPKGLRTTKTGPSGTIRYHYDLNGRVIAESDASNQVTAQAIWGHKALARKIGGQDYYYLYNGHGDVVQLVDTNGNVVNSYQYDEWGNITSKTELIANPLRYAGEYYDDETGLYYLRARYYDPTVGRFISQDTYAGDITNPLSLNHYTYCYNNPVVYIDPTGHWATSIDGKWSHPGNSNSPSSIISNDAEHDGDYIMENGEIVGQFHYDISNDSVYDVAWYEDPTMYLSAAKLVVGVLKAGLKATAKYFVKTITKETSNTYSNFAI